MIIGMWWQSDYTTSTIAYIHNIREVQWLNPLDNETTDIDLKDFLPNGVTWQAHKQSKEKRKEIVYFRRPIYTSKLTLRKIEFTARKWNSWFPRETSTDTFIDSSYVPYNLEHQIYVQIEIFGCPNFKVYNGEYWVPNHRLKYV